MLQRLRHAVGWGIQNPHQGTRIDFQVCAPVGHGQTIYLVGDIPALGGSIECEPSPLSLNENGVALVTTPDLYPIWYNLEPVIVPAGTIIKYRYAVCTGNKFTRFESLNSQNRIIEVGSDDLQTQDTLDSLEDKKPGESFDESNSNRDAVWGVVPRLSSGQAFFDRRANGDQDVSGPTWPKRSLKRSSMPLSESIPEEESDGFREEPQKLPRRSTNVAVAPASSVLEDDGRMICNSPVLSRARSYSDDSVKSPQNVTIESTDGVVIVVYRLPVLVIRLPDGKYHIEWEDDNLVCPSGLLKESCNTRLYRDRVSSMRITWVGTVHCSATIPKEDEELLAKKLEAFHCVPVFLNQQLADTFHGFCYGTLWPIFHNIVDVYGRLPTRWWNPSQQKNAWASYKNVNRIFVNKVIEVYNEGDLVWVHDLHLLVAPSFLSRRLPCVNVGLFLHTPFPSSEIFRTLSVRADLLRGMLSADHIGFHLYEHARHFLTSCRRILGLKYSAQPGGYIGIEYSGRVVMLTISHIGIEPPFMDLVNESHQVIQDFKYLAEKYKSEKKAIIVGIDRVERLKGIQLKLFAIEHLLTSYPEWQDKIQVIQVRFSL
jgi:trehalose 6-phosphate synthase/phosphatase